MLSSVWHGCCALELTVTVTQVYRRLGLSIFHPVRGAHKPSWLSQGYHCCGKTPWPKATYGRPSLFWLMVPRWGSMAVSSRHGSRTWKLRGHVFKPRHEVERANWDYSGAVYSWSPCYWCTSSSNSMPPKLPKESHPLGTKGSNTQAYGSHFSFKPNTMLCQIMKGWKRFIG